MPATVVLCGGESTRMGRPKAWLPFGDETLLQRTTRLLAACTSPVIVVAAPGQALPALPEAVRVVRDEVEGEGPLRAAATGLAAAAEHASLAYVSSTDAPFVSAAFVRRLCALAADHEAVVVSHGRRRHPLPALYATRLHLEAAALLSQGERRLGALLARARTRLVTTAELHEDERLLRADPQLDALLNLNTHDDYEAALRRLQELTR